MAQKNINIGSSPNKGDGDPIRTAFSKTQDNFTELYNRVVTVEQQAGIANPGGATIQQSIIGSVIGEDSTTIIDHSTNTIIANKITGDLTGSVVADDSTVLIDGVAGTINASALTGALPAIDGSALTGVASAFSDLTGTPTTIAGYGISDAYTKAEVDSSIASVTAGHFDFNITGDDSTVRTVTSGSTLQITGGTAITTASDADGNITINGVAQDFAFSSLTGTPTTIAGYGITDAFDGAFGSLSGTPTTLSGYGITDAATLAAPAFTGAVDFTGTTSVDFTGATVTGLTAATQIGQGNSYASISDTGANGEFAVFIDGNFEMRVDDGGMRLGSSSAIKVDTILDEDNMASNDAKALATQQSIKAYVDANSGGASSRSTATGTTSSLADAAEADLDITGFKSYALLTITTDRAARVRLYVSAATRTADASRAEGTDPTSDAGLIAEVITTGADTVIISPGAYGFNLESTPTTTIPCRVTNKSGSASTVQVDLNILQLES